MREEIKRAVRTKNLTVEGIGARLGICKGLVSRILSDDYKGYAYRPKIAQMLGLSGLKIWGPGWNIPGKPGRRPKEETHAA